MGKTEKTPITINNVEHFIEDMTEQQQVMINHVADLDRKIRSAEFNLDQLRIGREAFVNMLTQSLEQAEEMEIN
jgi:hypothetical protein